MHRLHGGYAQYFNRRHRYVGHLFQDRFKGVPVLNDPQLWTVAAYIARNPVTAGLCEIATEWPWSSHTALLAGRHPLWLDAPRLLAYFGNHGGDGLRRYVELVDLLSQHLPKGDSPL